MLIKSQTKYKFKNFAEQLNELKLNNSMKTTIKEFFYSLRINSKTLEGWLDTDVDADDNANANANETEIDATVVLYEQLTDLFECFSRDTLVKNWNNDSSEKHSPFDYICKLMRAILKCSEQFRLVATADNFIGTIIQQMERIYELIDGSFTEYIRRNGNNKTDKFTERLKLLLAIILSWYSVDCLQDFESIQALLCICQKFWPTIGANADLQLEMINMLLFISNDSLPGKCINTNF